MSFPGVVTESHHLASSLFRPNLFYLSIGLSCFTSRGILSPSGLAEQILWLGFRSSRSFVSGVLGSKTVNTEVTRGRARECLSIFILALAPLGFGLNKSLSQFRTCCHTYVMSPFQILKPQSLNVIYPLLRCRISLKKESSRTFYAGIM